MALSDRHRWCLSKLLESFAPDLTSEQAQSFIRQESNLQKFNSFFRGDGAGRLFISFQQEIVEGEVRLFVFYG
jgi:hypothetical protein